MGFTFIKVLHVAFVIWPSRDLASNLVWAWGLKAGFSVQTSVLCVAPGLVSSGCKICARKSRGGDVFRPFPVVLFPGSVGTSLKRFENSRLQSVEHCKVLPCLGGRLGTPFGGRCRVTSRVRSNPLIMVKLCWHVCFNVQPGSVSVSVVSSQDSKSSCHALPISQLTPISMCSGFQGLRSRFKRCSRNSLIQIPEDRRPDFQARRPASSSEKTQ